MTVSEQLFRLVDANQYVYNIDGLIYENFSDIPDTLFVKSVYTWDVAGTYDKLITITTLNEDNGLETALTDEMGIFPDYTESQIIKMLKSNVTLMDLIQSVTDSRKERGPEDE